VRSGGSIYDCRPADVIAALEAISLFGIERGAHLPVVFAGAARAAALAPELKPVERRHVAVADEAMLFLVQYLAVITRRASDAEVATADRNGVATGGEPAHVKFFRGENIPQPGRPCLWPTAQDTVMLRAVVIFLSKPYGVYWQKIAGRVPWACR
jgi:hypothetical protein